MCLLCTMMGTVQYHPEICNTETVGYLYLVDYAIVIFCVCDEGALTSYHHSHVNVSAFFNLLELEILEILLVR